MQPRYDVISAKISAVTMSAAIDLIFNSIESGHGGYVCFANVHTAVMARYATDYRDVLEQSLMTMPDGRPLFWMGKLLGHKNLEHLPGPDFLPGLFSCHKDTPLRHYFYGSTGETLNKLITNLKNKYPNELIVGYESPPFRKLTIDEERKSIEAMRSSGADVIWVGLGAPKQEKWMCRNWQELRPAVILGVGAAFDFHASQLDRAPAIMYKFGIEWLYRLYKEPRRLWKRYLVTNSLFIYLVIKDYITNIVSGR
jgi:N-acetylglucosaminyldiphosphoundecaprenol N-acetyl-beta-D-mannosaminyltransferase